MSARRRRRARPRARGNGCVTCWPTSTATESSTISAPSIRTVSRRVRSRATGASSRPRRNATSRAESSSGGRAGGPACSSSRARRPARQLQLPDTGTALDTVTERDAVACQHEIRGVVVGRHEPPRRLFGSPQLGEHEPSPGVSLISALDCLLHASKRIPDGRTGGGVFGSPGFRLTCAPVRLSLTPRTSEFFVLFARAGENALEVARLVERRFREHPNSGITQEQVKAAETEGDGITRDSHPAPQHAVPDPVRPRRHLHARDRDRRRGRRARGGLRPARPLRHRAADEARRRSRPA